MSDSYEDYRPYDQEGRNNNNDPELAWHLSVALVAMLAFAAFVMWIVFR